MEYRLATAKDVPTIVKMLADDELGQQREDYRDPLPEAYTSAFVSITRDPNQELIVVANGKDEIIGTMQLSFMQHLTYRGGIRAQIEAVRIHKDQRGKGLGKQMFEWAINRARERGAHLLQLTTDKRRPEALKFYESLGFKSTHEGMKLHL